MQETLRKSDDWRSFLKALAVIAIPVALQNLLSTTASMVDTLMLSKLGQEAVGAVGLCAQFTSLMFSGYWGFVGGGMLFIAQFWGAKNDEGVCKSYGLMLTCLMSVGLLFTIAGFFFPHLVMRMYTDKEELWPIGIRYLRIVAFSYMLQTLTTGLCALLRSTEHVRIPLITSIAGLITNLVFNYLLIFGKFGFPEMGVEGAATATLLAGIVNVIGLYLLGGIRKHPYILRFKMHFRWTKAFFREYMRKCFPIICNELLIGIGFMIINIVYGRQSPAAIAALAIFATFNGFVISFFSGFSNAASILVGKEVGAGNHELAFARGKRMILLTPVFVLVPCLIFLIFLDPFLRAMSLTGEAYDIGHMVITLFTFIAAIRMTNWMQNDTYRAAGDPVFGTVMEISFMYSMVIPCICLTGLVFKLPFVFVFLSAYVDEPIRVCIMLRNTWKGRWIKPVTKEGLATIDAFRAAHNIHVRSRKA